MDLGCETGDSVGESGRVRDHAVCDGVAVGFDRPAVVDYKGVIIMLIM